MQVPRYMYTANLLWNCPVSIVQCLAKRARGLYHKIPAYMKKNYYTYDHEWSARYQVNLKSQDCSEFKNNFSKYEEIYPPDSEEFVYITDDTYSRRQVFKMEQLILRELSYYLNPPTILYFVNRYTRDYKPTDKIRNLTLVRKDLDYLQKFISNSGGPCAQKLILEVKHLWCLPNPNQGKPPKIP